MLKKLTTMWSARSAGQKIGGALLGPLLVGVVLIGVEQAVTDDRDDVEAVLRAAQSAPAVSENLEVSDLAVIPTEVTEVLTDDLGGSSEERTVEWEAIDIAVRNKGTAISMIDRAEVRVLERMLVPSCRAEGGLVEISGRYSIMLTDSDTVGTTREATVRQGVPANAVDRFQLTVGGPPRFGGEPGVLVQVEVLLYHDNVRTPLNAGKAVLMPVGIAESATDPVAAEDPGCVRDNLQRLKRWKNIDGARSSFVKDLLEDVVAGSP